MSSLTKIRLPRLPVLIAALLSLLGLYLYIAWPVHVETVSFQSKLVGKALPYEVMLPRGYRLITSRWKRYPVLYLLHGYGTGPKAWAAQSGLKEYAASHELILVMPEGGTGWYTDSATVPADKYESYILQELIPDVDSRYRTIADRGGRGVAGFSMGGYGALKLGLKHPLSFAFAASMSGALDAATRTDGPTYTQTFGPTGGPTQEENDLFKIVRRLPGEQTAALPYLYLDCGTEDPWMQANRDMAALLAERKIAHEFRELPGQHEWKYWDRQLEEILRAASRKLSPAQ